jgi:hypothetical protein
MSGAERYGLIAEFAAPEAALAAARRLYLNGFRRIDAYTPFPVAGLDEAMRPGRRPLLPLLMFAGGVIGAVFAYFIEYWAAVINYPLNVGGRPLNSWPAFTVSAFEAMLLLAIAAGFFGLLLFCRLPRLAHPIFAAPDFDRASQDRFFLCVEAGDPRFDAERVRWLFEHLGAVRVSEVGQ